MRATSTRRSTCAPATSCEGLADQFNRMTAQAARIVRRPRAQGRRAHARAQEFAGAADGDQRDPARDLDSPTDVQPVLDAVAERAAHLCDAPFARVMVIDGDLLHPMADYSDRAGIQRLFGADRPYRRFTGRAVVDRADGPFRRYRCRCSMPSFRMRIENIRRLGCRAVLAVPLLREGGAYGGIFLFRREPGLFSAESGSAACRRSRGRPRSRSTTCACSTRRNGSARSADGDQRNPARNLELADRRADPC